MRAQAGELNDTRGRLLEMAGEVFAEKGFHRATVREIVRRAEANLNAVNYHFGDKEGLYRAVIETAQTGVEDDDAFKASRDSDREPSDRLRMFVRALLGRMLLGRGRQRFGRLMAMEMAQPTGLLDMVADRFIRPRFELLVDIVERVADNGMSRRQAELCAESIVGQCVHLAHCRQITTRLMPYLSYSPENIVELADHVARFSLASLKNLSGIQEDER